MSKRTDQAMAVCCTVAMLIAAGCANKEVVKSEEPVLTGTAPAITAPAKVQPEPDKAIPSMTEAVKPATAPATAAIESNAQTNKASALQASLENIYFAFDSSNLSKDARDVLSNNAETLIKARPDAKITIEGHCDERGSAEYNLALGERRAKSALQYLATLGVPTERLKAISYGKEKPAVQGSDESAWAKNRRDVFVEQQ